MSFSVLAEMVASVHSLEVEVGSEVTIGQTLLVLESMKMEIPVLCEHAGIVQEISVSTGDVVNEGDYLVIID